MGENPLWGIFLVGCHRKVSTFFFVRKPHKYDVITKNSNEIIGFPFNQLKSGHQIKYIECMSIDLMSTISAGGCFLRFICRMNLCLSLYSRVLLPFMNVRCNEYSRRRCGNKFH